MLILPPKINATLVKQLLQWGLCVTCPCVGFWIKKKRAKVLETIRKERLSRVITWVCYFHHQPVPVGVTGPFLLRLWALGPTSVFAHQPPKLSSQESCRGKWHVLTNSSGPPTHVRSVASTLGSRVGVGKLSAGPRGQWTAQGLSVCPNVAWDLWNGLSLLLSPYL